MTEAKPPRCAYKPRAYGSLAQATLALVEAAGGHTAAATRCSATDTTLQRYTDPDLPERSMPAHIIEELEAAVGEPWLSRHLVEKLGCTVLPALTADGDPDLTRRIVELGERTSQLFADFAAAMADGRLEGHEGRRLLADFDLVLRTVTHARVQIIDMIGEG